MFGGDQVHQRILYIALHTLSAVSHPIGPIPAGLKCALISVVACRLARSLNRMFGAERFSER